MRMLSDRVLVKPDEEEQKVGDIIIPDKAKQKPERGTAVAVGEGRARPDGSLKPMRIVVGDVVLYPIGVGNTIKLEGVEHLVLREEDVLAVLEPQDLAQTGTG